MAREFAVFDIDGTVIRWQLYHAVVGELAAQGHLPGDAAEQIRLARLAWKTRTHNESFADYEQTLVKLYLNALKTISVGAYNTAVEQVFATYKDQVYTYTRNMIRSLKSEGYVLLAISASQHEIVAKLADYYGFDDFTAATFGRANGHFTGEVQTPFHGKAEPLKQLVAKHNLSFAGSIGVGDSASDIPMLELTEHPIAFNPNRQLFKHARQAGWRVVVERKNMIYELEPQDGRYLLAQTNS